MAAQSRERPLIPDIILVCSFIVDKFGILLIDRVVGQMDISVSFEIILAHVLLIRLRGKARKSFVKHINP